MYEVEGSVGNLTLRQTPSPQEHRRPLIDTYLESPQVNVNIDKQSRLTQVRIKAVVQEWNEGFFAPRGLNVTLQFADPRLSPRYPYSPSGIGAAQNILHNEVCPTSPSESLLHQAVAKGRRSKVRDALERGEPLDTLNRKGETPLYKAVLKDEKAIVQMLLGKGANPALRPQGEYTPLQHAASRDKKSILKMLAEKCTLEEIDDLTPAGETALYLAVQKQFTGSVEVRSTCFL